MVRYAKPLRVSRQPLLGMVSAAALRVAGLDWMVRSGDEIEDLRGHVGDDFDDLYERRASTLGTAVVRDAAYVRWRFCAAPGMTTSVLAARRHGRLSGYVAWAEQGDSAVIRDWMTIDQRALDALFVAVLERARMRRCRSVSVVALETHPDLGRLRMFGFCRRPETSTAVSYATDGRPYRTDVINADRWFMTVGDRDV
jgi:hypothetical protein